MKVSREVREGRESEYAAVVALGSEVTRVDKMASDGSVREPRWMLMEQEVGTETEGCWRSARERRGRVTKPDSRPEERKTSRSAGGILTHVDDLKSGDFMILIM